MPFWRIQFMSSRHLSPPLSGHITCYCVRSVCGLHFWAMLSSIRQQIEKQMDAPDAPFHNLIRGYRISRRECSNMYKFGPPGGHVFCVYVCVFRFENNNGIVHSNLMRGPREGIRTIDKCRMFRPPSLRAFRPFAYWLLSLMAKPRLASLNRVRMFFASAPRYKNDPSRKRITRQTKNPHKTISIMAYVSGQRSTRTWAL